MSHKSKTEFGETKPFRIKTALLFSRALLAVALASLPIAQTDAQEPQTQKTSLREFQPGVWIDWNNQAVRLDARVVLREGPLELLACSPQTREHESILVVNARPLHIYQALGLIGLEPGSPPTYHEKLNQWQQAHGEFLDLRLEWKEGDKTHSVKPAEWMIEKNSSKHPQDLEWVFSGSVVREGDHFGADSEGTVVCVVDFDSALISLSKVHSADNDELWLSANPRTIPPMDTRCTLIIRSVYYPKVEVELTAEGRIKARGEEMSNEQIIDRLTRNRDDRTPRLVVSHAWELENREMRKKISELQEEFRNRKLDPDRSMCIKKTGGAPRAIRSLAPPP